MQVFTCSIFSFKFFYTLTSESRKIVEKHNSTAPPSIAYNPFAYVVSSLLCVGGPRVFGSFMFFLTFAMED